MAEQVEIKSVADAMNIGLRAQNYFFRGHARRIEGQPLPRVFRKSYNERSVIRDFIRIAPGLCAEVPKQTDYLHWLFLMQHHGAPTRLLDWTESIFTALFFAVYSEDPRAGTEDGEIWEISIYELNKISKLAIPPANHQALEYLAREPLEANPNNLARVLNVTHVPGWPIAFYPPLLWARMAAQKSTFSMHPRPIAPDKVFPDEAKLSMYLVRAENKPKIRRDLNLLGIDLYTLFPDLDALSKEIEYRYG
jgi:hypothetical protein